MYVITLIITSKQDKCTYHVSWKQHPKACRQLSKLRIIEVNLLIKNGIEVGSKHSPDDYGPSSDVATLSYSRSPLTVDIAGM
jgi:hypothetical protein